MSPKIRKPPKEVVSRRGFAYACQCYVTVEILPFIPPCRKHNSDERGAVHFLGAGA